MKFFYRLQFIIVRIFVVFIFPLVCVVSTPVWLITGVKIHDIFFDHWYSVIEELQGKIE